MIWPPNFLKAGKQRYHQNSIFLNFKTIANRTLYITLLRKLSSTNFIKRPQASLTTYYTPYILIAVFLFVLSSCKENNALSPVTVADFKEFVQATGYTTDAEKYGWSIVQKTVSHYVITQQANWQIPDGEHLAELNFPVTQISYNDAIAYCSWANVKLPSYDRYWKEAKKDSRYILCDAIAMRPASVVNIIGNTWDITTTSNTSDEVRLAGGSYLCNQTTCKGTSQERELFVSKDTGNSHISFVILK